MPTPALVMMALVAAFTPNYLAIKLITAVKGASSGTEIVLNGSLESEALVILKVTF